MSVQDKITNLNERIAQLDKSGTSFRSGVKVRVETIKDTLASLGERIKTLDTGAGQAREEVNNLLKSNEDLREEVRKIKEEKDQLQGVIDANDVDEISNKISESTASLDKILEGMENDDSVTDALSALEKQIESLEETLKDKTQKPEKNDDDEPKQGGFGFFGGKRKRRRTCQKY